MVFEMGAEFCRTVAKEGGHALQVGFHQVQVHDQGGCCSDHLWSLCVPMFQASAGVSRRIYQCSAPGLPGLPNRLPAGAPRSARASRNRRRRPVPPARRRHFRLGLRPDPADGPDCFFNSPTDVLSHRGVGRFRIARGEYGSQVPVEPGRRRLLPARPDHRASSGPGRCSSRSFPATRSSRSARRSSCGTGSGSRERQKGTRITVAAGALVEQRIHMLRHATEFLPCA